jgi:hypothetical protein
MLIGGEDTDEKLLSFSERLSMCSRMRHHLMAKMNELLDQEREAILYQEADNHEITEPSFEKVAAEWKEVHERKDAPQTLAEDTDYTCSVPQTATTFSYILSEANNAMANELMGWYVKQAKKLRELLCESERRAEELQNSHIEQMEQVSLNISNSNLPDKKNEASVTSLEELVKRHISECEEHETHWKRRIEQAKEKQKVEFQGMISTLSSKHHSVGIPPVDARWLSSSRRRRHSRELLLSPRLSVETRKEQELFRKDVRTLW